MAGSNGEVLVREEAMGGLAKGMAIVESFDRTRPRLTVSEAAALTDTTPAAARRCLRTLESLGYLSYDGKFYRPTPRLARLAQAYTDVDPLPVLAEPMLRTLRDELNESCSVAVLSDDDVLFVARAESTHVVHTGLRVGSKLPFHASAAGRVLAAALPDARLDELLGSVRPVPATPNSLSSVAEIRARIEQARADGYSLTDEELELGLRVIAVPVVDGSGATVASMTVSALTARATIDFLVERALPLLRERAERLGRML